MSLAEILREIERRLDLPVVDSADMRERDALVVCRDALRSLGVVAEQEHSPENLADELLGFPNVVEGLRRACLLRKETTPSEVVEHLRLVAQSYGERENKARVGTEPQSEDADAPDWLGLRHGRVHRDPGRARPARTVKVRRVSEDMLRRIYAYLEDRGDAAADQLAEEIHAATAWSLPEGDRVTESNS